MSKLVALVSTLVSLAALSCSKSSAETQSEPAAEATAVPAEAAVVSSGVEAKRLYTGRCAVCHGEKGTGDGPGAAALDPKPRNYTDAAWQSSVTDEQLSKVIVQGGAAVGKSPIMPASPDLEAKPEVVQELVKIVRSFKGG
jgi:mono/diheme cytochrome c family protein